MDMVGAVCRGGTDGWAQGGMYTSVHYCLTWFE